MLCYNCDCVWRCVGFFWHNNTTTQHKNTALVKTALGALVGGVAGIVCFRGGKGFRAASVATGVGAALGSTCERVRFRYNGAGNHRINNNNN